MPNALRIGLLGPLQVRDETGRSVRIGGRQLRVLLSLLALDAGRVVPAGSLAGHIWPDDPPGNPGSALQTLVSRLRAELRSSVLADGIEADLATGEGASLVGELRVLLSADPLAERPRALLMRALYAAGRQAEALAIYHEGRELLADRLGVDPSAQLEQVYLGILRGGGEPAVPVAPPAEVPADPGEGTARAGERLPAVRMPSPLTSFVGRDEDIARVLKNLRAARLVTPTGPGGVGKTRLAAEAPGRLDATAWFVPLAPVTDPAEVPSAVLGALGVREPVLARVPPGRPGTRWNGWPPRSPTGATC